jgi:hypothetical protein
MMCIGLAMVVPQTVYGTAMLIGAVLAFVWRKRHTKSFDTCKLISNPLYR